MIAIPQRAPIAYGDLRRRYNTVRGLGALVMGIAGILIAVSFDAPEIFGLVVPAFAIAADAAYRRRDGKQPFPGVFVDATAIGIAMYVRGSAPAIHAVAILALIVTGALLLPLGRAAIIVVYASAWSVAVWLLEESGLPGLGLIEGSGAEDLVDRIIATTIILVVIALLYQATLVILAAQDRSEEALAQERRAVELKNEFVSMVSHELRTPLTGIAGFTDTLHTSWQTLPPREVDEFLTIMSRETEHLANLVEDILVIPRLEAGHLRLDVEDLDLATEAHAVAGVVFAETDYSVSIPANVLVSADRTRLRQILRNLLENAKKYGGDQVLIEGELAAPGLYKLTVADNGRGVDESDQARIFQHFEQLSTGDARAQQGVGLGLPIARKLARAMGGDLWYEDRFPVGAKFCFTVLIAQTEELAPDDTDAHVTA